MKWIFKNEDRVWRDRGGRPGEETLSAFVALADTQLQFTHNPIPGFLVVSYSGLDVFNTSSINFSSFPYLFS